MYEAGVFIRTIKSEVRTAAIPVKDTENAIKALDIPPPTKCFPADNVLETSLSNIVGILDVPIVLGNIGLLANTRITPYYGFGLTPEIGRGN